MLPRPDHSRSATTTRWVELARQIQVCGRVIRDEVAEQVRRWRLSESEFFILWACRDAPSDGLSQSDLAGVLALSAAQVSGLVEQLRRQGLLDGRRAEADRRRQFWRPTPEGQARLSAVLDDLADWAAGLNGQLDAATPNELARGIDALTAVLRAPEQQGAREGSVLRPFHSDREGAA